MNEDEDNENLESDIKSEPLSSIPVKINGLNIQDFAPKELYEIPNNRPIIGSGGIPIESTIKDAPTKPTWLSQVGHEILHMNRLALAGEYVSSIFSYSPTIDEVPEGWTALAPESIENYPDQYWDYLTHAKSPNDLKARQAKVSQQIGDDERFASGSWSASIVGGAIGIFSDPSTYLLPLAVGGKYASIAQNVFLNMGKAAGGLALDSISRNILIQADRIGGNVQDLATDSLRDFIFSTALVGIGGALGGGLREAKLWNGRKVFNFAADGINISPLVDEEGNIIKEMHATKIPGSSASAAQVDAANFYIDETMHAGGIFHVPYVGKPISKFLAWGPLASPVMKAMNSSSVPLKSFFNRIASHGIITKGAVEGKAKAFTAMEYSEFYNDEAKSLAQFIRGKMLEANNISGGPNTINAMKNFTQAYQNLQTITDEDFGKEVRNVVSIKDYKSKFSQVHDVAEQTIKFFEKMGFDYHSAVGKGDVFLDPRNAFKYMPQNWNIPAMLNDPQTWKDITAAHLQQQDEQIQILLQPIAQANETLLHLKESGADQLSIKRAQYQVGRLETELNNNLINNSDYHILLEDRVLFNEQEVYELNNILKPVRDAEVHVQVIQSKLKPLEKENKSNPKNKIIKDKLKNARNELKEAEDNLTRTKDQLQRQAREGDINRKFFNRKGEEFEFLDPNKKAKFRAVFNSEFDRNSYVQQAYDAILNQTPDDLLQGVFGTLESGIIENPEYLKKRHLLFDTTEHNNLGFLDPDISKSIASYASTMGKIIGFKKAFPEFSESKGLDGVLGFFHQDAAKRRLAIEAKPKSEERTRELNKFTKEYHRDIKFMQDTYKVYMGTFGSKNAELYRWTASLKNLVASAKLGAVPIYQIAELGSIIMKQGVMPFLAQGLRPMLKTLNGHLKGPEAEERRLNAASAHIALWGVRNGYAEKLVNSNKQSYTKVSSISEKVGVATDNLSHVSGNLFGINYIANTNETIAANIFQSDVMQSAFAHQAGTLTEKQIVKMARYGIDIKKESKRFIENYKNSEGFEISGGYYSRYYKWKDLEASNLMSMAMRRMVKDTIVNGERFSSPYWAQDPIFSMIFMFHGWAYSALTHYAVPLMQRPDAENILGMLMVVGLSMIAEPLKRVVNGKEPYDNDTKWFEEVYKAIDYSGLLGPYAGWFQDLNSLTGGAIAPGLIAEKYHNRPKAGGFGPVTGYLSDLASSVGHGIIGDWTEGDVKRFERLMPLSSFLPLRYMANKWIESMDLPQTRRSANSWAYRQFLNGEGT